MNLKDCMILDYTGTCGADFVLAGAFFLEGTFLVFFLPAWHLFSPVLKQQLVIRYLIKCNVLI